MAILNVTPDSFSDGGQLYEKNHLSMEIMAQRIEQIVAEGADILDIGGESTRPGAEVVSEAEEMDRVLPAVEWAAKHTRLAISVDTSSPNLMLEAAKLGAHLINDVRALSRENALQAAAKTGLAVCLMHMQGAPKTMQDKPQYQNPVEEVKAYLIERVEACLQAGILADQLWIDPGFGFGKTLEHNVALLRELNTLAAAGYPVLAGLSRKSMIGHLLQRDIPDRLPGSLALGMMALQRGAKVLRVHDVQATRDIIDLYLMIDK